MTSSEGNNSQEGIRLYTPEDVKRFINIYNVLTSKLSYFGVSPVFDMGTDEFHNSVNTFTQLAFALAISEHELVQKILEMPDCGELGAFSESDLAALVQAGILKGKKILDLGCGFKQGFAQWCRKFGAGRNTSLVLMIQKLEGAPEDIYDILKV